MLGGTYSQGAITLTNGATSVSGIDVLWNDVLEGDELWPSGQGAMIIGADVVHPFDAIELLTPWPGATVLGSTYVIVKTSWKRHDVTELQKLWRTLAAELEATGNFIFVEGDEPDPEMGENGQFALKTNIAPWRLWYKEVNVWVEQGIPVGSIWRGEWEATTTYQINDVVGRSGSSYINVTADNLNKPPESNPDDWDLTGASGETGADGGVITIPYVFSTSTAMADPGSGGLRLNNATQNAATALALDLIDSRGLDFTSVLASALGTTNPVRGHIRIHKTTDTTKFLTLAISSETAPSGFRQYVCSVIGSSGATPFIDFDPVLVNFARAGDLGSQGIQGIQGIQGFIGNPGGAISLPYTVDGLSVMDSDPGAGKMRFNVAPQQAATILRFNDTTALGAPVGNQFDAITTASDSTTKVSGRVFVNGGTVPRLQFVVTAVEAKINYHNLTIAVVSASVPDPFPNGASIIVDWTPVGNKGNAATIAVGETTTGSAGTPATVVNVGTTSNAVFNFSIPEGPLGQPFTPTYVVPLLADRDDYDDDPVVNADGSRMSVLVESDSSNDDLPTLYFKQSNDPAVYSGGVTFQAAGAADAVTYDNTASGLFAINVQEAIDEGAAEKVDLAGDTMTGLLTLSGDPVAALDAVPKQYVDGKPALIISDAPPSSPIDGSMWWDADIGTLYVRYNDGFGPSQWVQATAVPFLDTSSLVLRAGDTMTGALTLPGNPTAALHAVPKQYADAPVDEKSYARRGATWAEVPRYQRFSLAGVKQFDVQVPAGANAARLSIIIFLSTATAMNVVVQVSVSPGVFKNTAGDYNLNGYYNYAGAPNVIGGMANVSVAGMYTHFGTMDVATIPFILNGFLTLRRPTTNHFFVGDFKSFSFATAYSSVHSTFNNFLNIGVTGPSLEILAFRLVATTGDNWAAESYLDVEWL